MQHRVQDSEQRCELAQRLNQNLADELGSVLEELDSLKRTVADSHSLFFAPTASQASTLKTEASAQVAATSAEADDAAVVVPSFLRVM